MRNYDVILFDLDGTLTDSAPGILNSVRYACRKLGLPVPGEETLRRFLGPPLIASFRELMRLDAADTDRAVSAFREYFPTKGLFENEVYPGVPGPAGRSEGCRENRHPRDEQARGVRQAHHGALRFSAVLRFHLRCHAG